MKKLIFSYLKTRSKSGKFLRNLIFLFISIAVIIFFSNYIYLAWLRAHPGTCYREETSPDRKYILEVCELRGDGGALNPFPPTPITRVRIYNAESKGIYYEETVIEYIIFNMETLWGGCDKRFHSTEGKICTSVTWGQVSGNTYNPKIKLPPSIWQKFKAKLP